MVSPRARRAALLAVALLLVFNPFYLDGLLHVDDPNRYEYHAEQVQFRESGYPNVPADIPALADEEEIECLFGGSRACVFERFVLREGHVTAPAEPGWSYDGRSPIVFVNGSFYRTRSEFVDGRSDAVRLSLERLPRETALDDAATPFNDASPAARTAISEGPVTRQRAIPDARTIVEHDGDYYVVYAKYGRWVNDESFTSQRNFGNALEGAISALGVLLGLRLFARWVEAVE